MKRIALKRGFAAMSPERRKAAGQKGGLKGQGHKWTPETAATAGKKGGYAKADRCREGETPSED